MRPWSQPAVLLIGLLAACEADTPSRLLTAREVESPAGSASEEPFLSASGDTVYMSWLERAATGGHELVFARLVDGVWSAPRVIESSDRFFVNWADFPSITSGTDGTLWAHWLERGGAGHGYGVRVTRSTDGGATWSEAWTPHEYESETEHGFVSAVPLGPTGPTDPTDPTGPDGDDLGFFWLDGRGFATASPSEQPREETALYFRTAGTHGSAGPETPVDLRVCDCCQTDAAVTDRGPLVVYRDRSPDEIRDIYVAHRVNGEWTEGIPVHADGWQTGACPVNGPAVAARGERVAVAWFTAPEGVPKVHVAFSRDSGRRFAEPVVVDDGNPAGRVDLLMLGDGSAVVSWLERTGGEWAEVRVRHVGADGAMGESLDVSASSSERASGFPRIAQVAEGATLVAWTDVSGEAPRVRVARVEVGVP